MSQEVAHVNMGQIGHAVYKNSTATVTAVSLGVDSFAGVLIINGPDVILGSNLTLTPSDGGPNVTLTTQEQQDLEGSIIPGNWTTVRFPGGITSRILLIFGT